MLLTSLRKRALLGGYISTTVNHSSSSPLVCPSLPPHSLQGFLLLVLLGSPIGSATFCTSTILKRGCQKCNLRDIQDCQMETSLLRSCLSLPKISCMLRICSPHLGVPAFLDIMRDTLADLCISPLLDWSWLKASLPVTLGGLNFHQALLHAPAAFIGALHDSAPLMTKILGHPPASMIHPSCVPALAEAPGRPEWVSLQDIDMPNAPSRSQLTSLPSMSSYPSPPCLVSVPLPTPLPVPMLVIG